MRGHLCDTSRESLAIGRRLRERSTFEQRAFNKRSTVEQRAFNGRSTDDTHLLPLTAPALLRRFHKVFIFNYLRAIRRLSSLAASVMWPHNLSHC
jgi:hypothetical protein